MRAILQTHFQSGAERYASAGRIIDSSGRYIRKSPAMTRGVTRFRLTKVSVAEPRDHVPEAIDVSETIVGVEGKAMDATHEATLRTFLVGAAAMVGGGFAALIAPSFSVSWLSNAGLMVLALGALVAAGASERYRRG
jgi:hypothetical protein